MKHHPLSCLLSVLLPLLLILAIYAREVTSIATSCSISAAELKALEALYRSTNGTEWKWPAKEGVTKWSFPADASDPCTKSWFGITCRKIGTSRQEESAGLKEASSVCNVKELKLQVMGLKGTLPSEIGALSGLVELNLRLNELRGLIPKEIGHLTALSKLVMIRNMLTGQIPSEIGYITGLTQLNLFKNSIVGTIPSTIGALTALQSLDLFANSMMGPLPTQIGQLTGLTMLKIQLQQSGRDNKSKRGGKAAVAAIESEDE